LGLLNDSGKGNKEEIENLINEVIEIGNMIAAGVMKLKKKNYF